MPTTKSYLAKFVVNMGADGNVTHAWTETNIQVLDDNNNIISIVTGPAVDVDPTNVGSIIPAASALAQVTTLNTQVATLTEQLATAQTSLIAANSHTTDLQNQVTTLTQQVTTLTNQVSTLEAANNAQTYEALLNTANAQISNLSAQLQAIQAQNVALTAQNVTLTTSNASLASQNDTLQAQLPTPNTNLGLSCFGWQGRAVLKMTGQYPEALVMLQQMTAGGNAGPEEAFNSAVIWYKDSPSIQLLAKSLGINDADLTALFMRAKALTV